MDLSNDFSLYKIHLDDCFYIFNFFIVRSVHSETMSDLIWEKGIYYKKIPISFQWKINGNIKVNPNGKKEGTWLDII